MVDYHCIIINQDSPYTANSYVCQWSFGSKKHHKTTLYKSTLLVERRLKDDSLWKCEEGCGMQMWTKCWPLLQSWT